jgi:hypothetical protein
MEKNATYEAGNTLSYFYVCVPHRFWEFIVAQKDLVSTTKYCKMYSMTVFLLLTYMIWNQSIVCSNFWNFHDVKIEFANDENRDGSRNFSLFPIPSPEVPAGSRQFCFIQPP